jgi:integrase
MTPRATKGQDFPQVVKSGSAEVRIYRTTKADGYTSYAASFYLEGKRKVRFFQDLDSAKREARKTAEAINNGQPLGVGLDASTRLAYIRAEELLAPLDIAVDVAVSRYVEARRILADVGADVVEAARDYARRHAGIVANKTVSEAVKELLEQIEIERNNTSNGTRRKEAWAKLLSAHLGKVSRDFNCDAAALDSSQIEPWLVGLQCSERTRRNVRDCFAFFIRWCKGRNYLPKDADPLLNVQNFRKRKRGVVEIINADGLVRLFGKAEGDFIPYLALRSFAGLRDSEARALDWSNIDLSAGWIDIPEAIAKQSDSEEGVARMVKVRETLAAWLRPYLQKSGPVCKYVNTAKKLAEVAEAAQVDLPRNCLRHSFISAAVTLSNDLNAVAIESGNSPAVIRSHYWRRMRPNEAETWFRVLPAGSQEVGKVVPLRFAKG